MPAMVLGDTAMISRGLKTNSKQQNKFVNMLAEDSAECYEDTPQVRDTGLGVRLVLSL